MTPKPLPLASFPELVRTALDAMTSRVAERSRRNADEARRWAGPDATYPATHGTHGTEEAGLGSQGRLGKHDW